MSTGRDSCLHNLKTQKLFHPCVKGRIASGFQAHLREHVRDELLHDTVLFVIIHHRQARSQQCERAAWEKPGLKVSVQTKRLQTQCSRISWKGAEKAYYGGCYNWNRALRCALEETEKEVKRMTFIDS